MPLYMDVHSLDGAVTFAEQESGLDRDHCGGALTILLAKRHPPSGHHSARKNPGILLRASRQALNGVAKE